MVVCSGCKGYDGHIQDKHSLSDGITFCVRNWTWHVDINSKIITIPMGFHIFHTKISVDEFISYGKASTGQRDDTLQLQHMTWWSHDDHDADGLNRLNRLNRLNPLWFGHKAVQSLHQEAASFWFQSYTKKSWKFLTPGNQLTSACTCCGASPCFSSSVHLTCQIYQATLHGHFASLRFPKLISNC
jgi:hypothetical protein